MKLDTSTHIYRQILDDIRKKAVCGDLVPGQKLPSVRSLAELYQINPNTAARIYKELEAQGLAVTRKGLGTYLCSDAQTFHDLREQMLTDCISRFIREMEDLGCDTGEMQELMKLFFPDN
jgi:DNA-binding transcriptional regulator YhcF (GntR family)